MQPKEGGIRKPQAWSEMMAYVLKNITFSSYQWPILIIILEICLEKDNFFAPSSKLIQNTLKY